MARVFTWWMAPALRTFAFAPSVLKLLDSRSQTIMQIMHLLNDSSTEPSTGFFPKTLAEKPDRWRSRCPDQVECFFGDTA